jgi:predicted kinase
VGIPASGKSSWAKEYLAKNPNTVSVSRDDFRYGLRNTGVTEPKIEDLITDLVDTTIIKCLNKNLNVIVDATNLKVSYINHFVELVKYKASVEFRIFDTPLDTCILRDSKRERKVGEHVIKKMYKQYRTLVETYPFQNIPQQPAWKDRFEPLKQDKSLPEAIIVDLDGTLFVMNNRTAFDWDKVDNDDLNETVADLVKRNKDLGRKIILVSGRDEEAREKTIQSLEFYDIKYDELFMRPKGSFEKDTVIKKRIFNEKIFNKYNVFFSIDDRLVVCKMWAEMGIFCICVNQGLKEF